MIKAYNQQENPHFIANTPNPIPFNKRNRPQFILQPNKSQADQNIQKKKTHIVSPPNMIEPLGSVCAHL